MGQLDVEVLGRGMAWLDTGTHESLLDASQFIETIERRQGLKVACLEEIAYRLGYITAEQLERMVKSMNMNGYGLYLLELLRSGRSKSNRQASRACLVNFSCTLRCSLLALSIPELLILEPKVLGDSRGFFYESFNKKTFCRDNAHQS